MKIRNSVYLILFLFSSTASWAGPFGINQGDKVSSLKIVSKRSAKTFLIQVPQPNSNFDFYGVVATPVHGVCAVYAETKPFATWEEAKDKRNSVHKLLAKYGRPTRVKTDMSYETMVVRPPIESYDLEWRKLTSPLSTISLEVTGSSLGQSVRLTYFFRNMGQCANWEPMQDKRGL